jgi:hypothetical protein
MLSVDRTVVFYENLVASAATNSTGQFVNSWEIFYIMSNTFGDKYSVNDTKRLINKLVDMNLIETFEENEYIGPHIKGVKILTPVEIVAKKKGLTK